jgi:hypothetical protein
MHCVRRARWERGGGVEGLREGEPIRRLDYFGFGRNWCLFSVFIFIFSNGVIHTVIRRRHHPHLSALCSSSRRNFNWLRDTREQVRGAVPRRHIPPLLSHNTISKYRFARALQNVVPVPTYHQRVAPCFFGTSAVDYQSRRVNPLKLRIGCLSCCYLIGSSRTEPASVSESQLHLN